MPDWKPMMIPMGVLAMATDPAELRAAALELAEMATPEAAKVLIDLLSDKNADKRNAAAGALDSMGIHSETFTDIIANGGRIETEITDDGFLKVNIYDGETSIKTYTFELYIDHFESSDIAFMDSTEHDACYWWIKEKADSGVWEKDYTLINFE